MDRRKIRRVIFLCLWALSLWAISFSGGAVSYGFFFGMSLLPLISLVYILCVSLRFKIYQELESRSMVCGEPTGYFFVLQNEDHFAFTGVSIRLFSDFSDVEDIPGDTEYELLPGDKFTYETRLACKYRGEYEVGVKEVAVTDFLGLFRVRYPNPETIKALVRPKLVELTELNGVENLQIPLQRECFGNAEPDIPVRDYVEGDSMRQIHWKAAARQGKLLVRTRENQEKQGIFLICDTIRHGRRPEEYLPLENKILEVLLALGYFFSARGVGFCASYSQGGLVRQQVQGMKDFEGFYQKVSGVVFGEETDVPDVLEQAWAQGWLWDCRLLFLVLHKPDGRVLEAAERLSAGGTAVVVYAVTEEDLADAVRQAGGRCRVIPVSVEGSLEGRL